LNWSTTIAGNCNWSVTTPDWGLCSWSSCTTGYHTFNNIITETCWYSAWSYRLCTNDGCWYLSWNCWWSTSATCNAIVTQVWCY
jgi:hypothetical protein